MANFSAQKIHLMGLNRSPLVNVFSFRISDLVAGSVVDDFLHTSNGKVNIFKCF